MQPALFSTAAISLLILIGGPVSAMVTTSVDPETQLQSWALQDGAFSLQLIQRLPDQTRAFYMARGFSRTIANDLGTQCVLQAIGKNTSAPAHGKSISYDLHDWVVRFDSNVRTIKFKEQWDAEWDQQGVSKASRLAFRWATFPTQQAFEPGGDYNWGMISFGLPPAAEFDLLVVWQQNGEPRSRWIKKIKCPPDL